MDGQSRTVAYDFGDRCATVTLRPCIVSFFYSLSSASARNRTENLKLEAFYFTVETTDA